MYCIVRLEDTVEKNLIPFGEVAVYGNTLCGVRVQGDDRHIEAMRTDVGEAWYVCIGKPRTTSKCPVCSLRALELGLSGVKIYPWSWHRVNYL